MELRLQNDLTLHMPLWQEGYSELTATEKKQTQEKLCLLPICLKANKDIYKVLFISTRGTKVGYRTQHQVLMGPRRAP